MVVLSKISSAQPLVQAPIWEPVACGAAMRSCVHAAWMQCSWCLLRSMRHHFGIFWACQTLSVVSKVLRDQYAWKCTFVCVRARRNLAAEASHKRVMYASLLYIILKYLYIYIFAYVSRHIEISFMLPEACEKLVGSEQHLVEKKSWKEYLSPQTNQDKPAMVRCFQKHLRSMSLCFVFSLTLDDQTVLTIVHSFTTWNHQPMYCEMPCNHLPEWDSRIGPKSCSCITRWPLHWCTRRARNQSPFQAIYVEINQSPENCISCFSLDPSEKLGKVSIVDGCWHYCSRYCV